MEGPTQWWVIRFEPGGLLTHGGSTPRPSANHADVPESGLRGRIATPLFVGSNPTVSSMGRSKLESRFESGAVHHG